MSISIEKRQAHKIFGEARDLPPYVLLVKIDAGSEHKFGIEISVAEEHDLLPANELYEIYKPRIGAQLLLMLEGLNNRNDG